LNANWAKSPVTAARFLVNGGRDELNFWERRCAARQTPLARAAQGLAQRQTPATGRVRSFDLK